PTLSHLGNRLWVAVAVADSALAATFVATLKLTGLGMVRPKMIGTVGVSPEPPSVWVHGRLTFALCHAPSGCWQVSVGPLRSSLNPPRALGAQLWSRSQIGAVEPVAFAVSTPKTTEAMRGTG